MVDGLWGGGENSCREPFSQLRRVNGARPLPSAVRRLRLRCRLNEGRVHVDYLTDLVHSKGISSTSDNEQMPGGASLPRDEVSQRHISRPKTASKGGSNGFKHLRNR